MKKFWFATVPALLIVAGLVSCQSVSKPADAVEPAANTAGQTLYYVPQAAIPATATAVSAPGAITVYNPYGSSSNNFAYGAPWYYGKAANGIIALPTKLSGDFSITATLKVSPGNTNANSGIGIGLTTGFDPTDKYAYALLSNATNTKAAPINLAYVSGAGVVTNTAGTCVPAVYEAGSYSGANITQPAGETTISFSRTGKTLSYGLAGGTPGTLATSQCTDGTTVFGDGPVYPSISYVRTAATITSLVITDGSGKVLFDLAKGGTLKTFYPATLSLGSPTTNVILGVPNTVTATAYLDGAGAKGKVGKVSAVSKDSSIATVSVANGTANATITVTGVASGSTTVLVTNDGDTNATTRTKSFNVTVLSFPDSDAYGELSASQLYPAPGASNAYTDGELSITFANKPTLLNGGVIKIYKEADGSEADSISFAGEVQNVPTSKTTTTPINVGTQLVRISGNTLFITPHFGKLAYGTKYFVAIPSGVVNNATILNGIAFKGFSNKPALATWNFTTRNAPILSANNITVDGSPTSSVNFRTVGAALHYLAANPIAGASSVTINVAAGTYTELVQYRPATANLGLTITIKGPAGNNKGDNCVIQYTNGQNLNTTQQMRASFYFAGANLVLQNLTLKNTGVKAAVSQAEALYFDSRLGSTLAAFNSSFISRQDTINTSGRNWFYNCYIEGNTDFIWGTADAALFENSSLRVFNDAAGAVFSLLVARTNGLVTTNGALTYATNLAKFNGSVGKGYVLLNSTISVDKGISATYARDAGVGVFYDQVALINNTFSGEGAIANDATSKNKLWTYATAPLKLGDSSYVGWKAVGSKGLGVETITNDAAVSSATIVNQASEYDTRDHILNRVITVTAGLPTGYDLSPLGVWDISSLAKSFGL